MLFGMKYRSQIGKVLINKGVIGCLLCDECDNGENGGTGFVDI